MGPEISDTNTPWNCQDGLPPPDLTPLAPRTTPGLIGSPMAVPWGVWECLQNPIRTSYDDQ